MFCYSTTVKMGGSKVTNFVTKGRSINQQTDTCLTKLEMGTARSFIPVSLQQTKHTAHPNLQGLCR